MQGYQSENKFDQIDNNIENIFPVQNNVCKLMLRKSNENRGRIFNIVISPHVYTFMHIVLI